MKLFLLAAIIFGIVVWLKLKFANKQNDTSQHQGRAQLLAKENDKLIVIDNVDCATLTQVLKDFRELYKEAGIAFDWQLRKVSNEQYALTFPSNIDFMHFCFLINFLQYPSDITWHARVVAWATISSADEMFDDFSVSTKAMLFVPSDDTEYDNVCLTTQEGKGYKVDFGSEKARPLLVPKEQFVPIIIDVEKLKILEAEVLY